MTREELKALIQPYVDKAPVGITELSEFDLDGWYSPDDKLRGHGFSLWFDGDTWLNIALDMNNENASLIQSVVRELGREVFHTWAMQYNTDPTLHGAALGVKQSDSDQS